MKKMFRVAYFSYKKYLEDPFPKLLKKRPELFQNGSILDIGANIGFTASVFCSGLSPGESVYAFEPDTTNFIELQLTAERFSKIGKIEPILAAIGETEGEIELWQNQDHHGDHRILTDDFKKTRKFSDSHRLTVPLVSIDKWVETGKIKKPIQFIKIDIQGYEVAALRGMRKTLEETHPALTIEYCPTQIRELGFDPEEMLRLIREMEYEINILNQDGSTRALKNIDIESLSGAHGYLNLLCERKSL
jgi:FkbM family methyltransferase